MDSAKLILKEISRYNLDTYADIIYRNALLYTDDWAFKYGARRVAFADFNSRVNRLIHALNLVYSKLFRFIRIWLSTSRNREALLYLLRFFRCQALYQLSYKGGNSDV